MDYALTVQAMGFQQLVEEIVSKGLGPLEWGEWAKANPGLVSIHDMRELLRVEYMMGLLEEVASTV